MPIPPQKNKILQLGTCLVLSAIFGYTPRANAFVRTQGCNADGDVCSELFWPTNCATYLIDRTSAQKVATESGFSLEALQSEIDASFAAWDNNNVGCSYLTLSDGGMEDGLSFGFDNDGSEDNVITFVEDGWLDLGPGHAQSAIALTSVFFDPETGVIVDADMEFNAEFFRPMIIGQSPADPFDERTEADLRNTITHEAGHFLGLAHTPVSDATMFAVAEPGESKKQSLAQDDLDGVCAIYPINEDPGICEPAGFTPKNLRIGNCAVDEGSIAESNGSLLLVAALFGLSLVVVSWRRRDAK
jgi:hypothetical protein